MHLVPHFLIILRYSLKITFLRYTMPSVMLGLAVFPSEKNENLCQSLNVLGANNPIFIQEKEINQFQWRKQNAIINENLVNSLLA